MTIKILLLDTTSVIERLVRDTLVPLGCQIIPASSPALGVFLARKNYPSLVICGLSAVGEELELAGEIKSDPELSHIPVVVVATGDDAELDAAALQYGADKCLHQPLPPERLVWELREFLVTLEDDRPEETSE